MRRGRATERRIFYSSLTQETALRCAVVLEEVHKTGSVGIYHEVGVRELSPENNELL
jgi:hypothetical protein